MMPGRRRFRYCSALNAESVVYEKVKEDYEADMRRRRFSTDEMG